MAERERDNGELHYTLRSIAKNAPWVRKIHILVNGHVSMPDWVPEKEKTVWVDRCMLLPKGDCPTRNSFAVMTVVHKVPDMAEHFIYVEDDTLLTQPSKPDNFFAGLGRPYYFATGGIQPDFYDSLENTGLEASEVPTKVMGLHHLWQPLTKSMCAALETKFPKWFSLVRSHWKGRFSSRFNETGTARSEKENSLEESLENVWPWYMQEHDIGTYSNVMESNYEHDRIGNYSNETWQHLVQHPPLIQNINDDMATATPEAYRHDHNIMTKYLDQMFPDPNAPSAGMKPSTGDPRSVQA